MWLVVVTGPQRKGCSLQSALSWLDWPQWKKDEDDLCFGGAQFRCSGKNKCISLPGVDVVFKRQQNSSSQQGSWMTHLPLATCPISNNQTVHSLMGWWPTHGHRPLTPWNVAPDSMSSGDHCRSNEVRQVSQLLYPKYPMEFEDVTTKLLASSSFNNKMNSTCFPRHTHSPWRMPLLRCVSSPEHIALTNRQWQWHQKEKWPNFP